MSVSATLTLAPGCSPWRLRPGTGRHSAAVTDRGGGANMRRASSRRSVFTEATIDCKALAAQIALYGAPIVALAQRLTAVAETLRLSELVDFVVGSCLVGGRDTFADRLYLVDPGVSRVSGLEHGAIRAIEALPGTSCTRPE